MKSTTFIIFLLLSKLANGQVDLKKLDQFYEGEIIDSTVTSNLIIFDNYWPHYYSFKAKYPLSSQTITQNANSSIKEFGHFKENGYITFKFMIDNEGEMNYIKYTQMDENYHANVFSKTYISQLLNFLKTLNNWEKAHYVYKGTKTPVSYMSYISFKIKDGKVNNIIP